MKAIMHILLLSSLLASACAPGIVGPEAELRSGLSASIRRVETFGLFRSEERRGSLRLVVTRGCAAEG